MIFKSFQDQGIQDIDLGNIQLLNSLKKILLENTEVISQTSTGASNLKRKLPLFILKVDPLPTTTGLEALVPRLSLLEQCFNTEYPIYYPKKLANWNL